MRNIKHRSFYQIIHLFFQFLIKISNILIFFSIFFVKCTFNNLDAFNLHPMNFKIKTYIQFFYTNYVCKPEGRGFQTHTILFFAATCIIEKESMPYYKNKYMPTNIGSFYKICIYFFFV